MSYCACRTPGVLRPVGEVEVGATVVIVGRAAEGTETHARGLDPLLEPRAGDHRHVVPLAHEMARDLQHRADMTVNRVRRQEESRHERIHFVRFGL